MSGSGSIAQFGNQLPMFLAPHEIAQMRSHDTMGFLGDWREDTKDMLDPRHDEETGDASEYMNKMRSQIESQGGITKPVHAIRGDGRQPLLIDGHHRAVTGMETNRMVPVLWHQEGGGFLHSAMYGPHSDDYSHGV